MAVETMPVKDSHDFNFLLVYHEKRVLIPLSSLTLLALELDFLVIEFLSVIFLEMFQQVFSRALVEQGLRVVE